MWLLYASLSAVFAGITAILAKCGVRDVNSNLATAVRTVVVLIFTWLMVAIVGSFDTIYNLTPHTWLFLILSGLATGASWLCYFKALQLGNVNKVTPVDKSSTIMTIALAVLVFNEPIGGFKAAGVVLLTIGTYLMIERKQKTSGIAESRMWLVYALLSAVFAALVAILAKIGISGVESNLGTAIRTVVVLVMAWLVVVASRQTSGLRQIDRKSLWFICLSGITTGMSWLCYFKALQEGPASVVVPIDKLSILLTILFSYLFLHERLSRRALIGLLLITAGTLFLLSK